MGIFSCVAQANRDTKENSPKLDDNISTGPKINGDAFSDQMNQGFAFIPMMDEQESCGSLEKHLNRNVSKELCRREVEVSCF